MASNGPRVHAAGWKQWWTWAWPALAWAILVIATFSGGGAVLNAAAGAVLIATVFAAVYHASGS